MKLTEEENPIEEFCEFFFELKNDLAKGIPKQQREETEECYKILGEVLNVPRSLRI